MLKFARPALLVVASASMVVGLAAPAFAAPSAWQFVDITLQTEQQQSMLLVSGELPETVPLPYEGELAVPAGMQVQWVGEILGGAVSEDPQMQYVKTTSGELDIYRFTLTKSRIAQIEGTVTGMGTSDGVNFTSALKWVAWQDLPQVRIVHRVPRGAQVTVPAEGASLQPGDEQFSYYAKTVTDAKAGDVVDLGFTYALPAGGAATSPSGGSDSIAVVFVIAAIVLLLGILVLAARIRPAAVDEVEEPEPVAPKSRSRNAAVAKAATTPAKTVAAAPKATAASSKKQVQEEPVPEASAPRFNPRVAIVIALAVLAVGVVMVLSGAAAPKSSDGKITKFFGSTSPCTSTSLTVTPNAGVDLAEEGERLVDSFMGYDGIGDVTLDLQTSVIDVTFCSSSQTEDSVRGIVESSGLVTLAAAPAASAPATATTDPAGAE